MVLTLEPGIYVRAADDIPKAFHGIGIRIEDDALVTDAGCELLTSDVPKAAADIEALMAERAPHNAPREAPRTRPAAGVVMAAPTGRRAARRSSKLPA